MGASQVLTRPAGLRRGEPAETYKSRQSAKPTARSRERTVGNGLLALGIGLLLLIGAAYGCQRWEGWLDAQQRYVVIGMVNNAQLVPFLPPLPSASQELEQLSPFPTTVIDDSQLASPLPPLSGTRPGAERPPPSIPTAVPVRIVIPKIAVNAHVVEIVPQNDGSWGTAAYAVAYHAGTGLIGEANNIVLSGHNNFQGEVFRRLAELQAGDEITLYSADNGYRYVVQETAIVPWVAASAEDRRRHVQYLLPTPAPTLTLVSCWPYWVYTHRVYVVATPAS